MAKSRLLAVAVAVMVLMSLAAGSSAAQIPASRDDPASQADPLSLVGENPDDAEGILSTQAVTAAAV